MEQSEHLPLLLDARVIISSNDYLALLLDSLRSACGRDQSPMYLLDLLNICMC